MRLPGKKATKATKNLLPLFVEVIVDPPISDCHHDNQNPEKNNADQKLIDGPHGHCCRFQIAAKKHKKVQCFNVIFVACCNFFCNLESTTVMANAGLLEVMAVVTEAEHIKALWTFLSNIIRISRWMCHF